MKILNALCVLIFVARLIAASEFSSRWMKHLEPFISHQTLLDITLPGTHDSMTWDLSTSIADGANDIPLNISLLFHDLGDILRIGNAIRHQAVTQRLNVTEQLEAGIRFLDFRVQYTAPPFDNSFNRSTYSWYCLHLVQSYHTAYDLLAQARAWMIAHPTEIVVFWISHHGNQCHTHYPGTSREELRQLWFRVTDLFGNLTFDTSKGLINETSIGQLLQRGQRAVFYVSAYEVTTNGTGRAHLATDGCLIDNQTGDQVSRETSRTRSFLRATLRSAKARRKKDKARNMMFLLSMAGSAPKAQMFGSALLQVLPFLRNVTFHNETLISSCIDAFQIPGLAWCPPTLLSVGQLTNYYNQFFFEDAFSGMWNVTDKLTTEWLPGAIYIDAVGSDGTIQTARNRSYAYVATCAGFNLMSSGKCATNSTACTRLRKRIELEREQHPMRLWEDPTHGRHVFWPK